jgi:hypothetical protein
MSDQSTHQETSAHAAAPTSGAVATSPATPASAPAGHDVMKILADVEGQLTRLRTAQKQQDDAISSLTARSKALRSAEDEVEKQRSAAKQHAQYIERERGQLENERTQFGEQCKRIDEELRRRAAEVEQAREKLERDKSDMAANGEKARHGLAELEHAKTVWQQNREKVEQQLQRSQAESDQRFAECAKAKDEIAAARSQWEKQRQDAQAKYDSRAADLDRQMGEVARREQALQVERERIAAAELQMQRQQQEMASSTASLEKERADLLKRVEQAERNVGELIEQVERTQQEVADRTQVAQQAMDRLAALQQKEKALEKAAEAAQEHAKRAEKESQELLRLADSERTEVQQKLEARHKELIEARDAAIAELEAARKKVTSMQRDLRARDEEIAAKEGLLADLQRKLETACSKLSEFASVLSEQTPQLERGAAALAMVEEQAQQIDRLTKHLAELQLASDPEEIQRRDQRINELTEALRQSRGQNAGEQVVAEMEQRNAALEAELQRLRLESQNAHIAAEEARKQLQSLVDSGANQQVKDVALAEHAAKVAALSAEIERLHAVSAQEVEKHLTAQSKKHQQEIAEARGAEARGAEHTTRQLRQRVADLEAEVAKAKSEAIAATAAASAAAAAMSASQASHASQQAGEGVDGEYVNRLRAKAQQITAVAEHLRRRRSRLERARLLMRQKRKAMPSAGAQGSAQMRIEQMAKMENERQHLLDVRKMLAASEQQMIRRWARQRAVFSFACVGIILAVSAAASWVVVNQLYPPKLSASVVLEARARAGAPAPTPDQLQEWSTWHSQVVTDSSFQQTLAKRMADRNLDQWSRQEQVASTLSKQVVVAADQPGVVMFSMAGPDGGEMTAFLDVLAQTVLTESNKQAGRRSDNATTVATGERKEEGRVLYASLNPLPLSDDRMMRALPIFGGTVVGLMILTLLTYFKLIRSKRIFDEENAALFQDRPSPA